MSNPNAPEQPPKKSPKQFNWKTADIAEMVVLWLFTVAFAVALLFWCWLSVVNREITDVPGGFVAFLAVVPIGKALERFAKGFYLKHRGADKSSI